MAGATTGTVSRRTLGRRAENRAFRFLCAEGLRPVARNFRTRHGEIDLVMCEGSCLVFVEVRARGSGSFVEARLTVDARKQRKLACAALLFLARNPVFRNHACRFDVMGVDPDDDSAPFDWLRDAFRPDLA
jgi:putative endonuclease